MSREADDVIAWCYAALLQLRRIRDQHFIQTDGRQAAEYSADLHFLLIACANLVKSLRRARRLETKIPQETRLTLTKLRDYSEHWEEAREKKGRAFTFFSKRHPGTDPKSATWHEHGISIAGLVDLNTLWQQVEEILAAAASE
jgi:hypothetical protein